eukprot:TRINITY_DN19423_c0_g1_i4.p1 TRINITY_DN19423_c0_g1~~TRINITY_DN19423_c0_g1_i4.p1  ORF type:complete len:105 (+),score=25.49 TRINITY_DN19423_c0_g1_i4:475-789(+)
MFAATTKFSAPDPGIHWAITSRDSSLISIAISENWASNSCCSNTLMSDAPETQQARASTVLSRSGTVSYTHLRAHETPEHLVCRLLLEKKKKKQQYKELHYTSY